MLSGEEIFLGSYAQFKLKAGEWSFPKSLTLIQQKIYNTIEYFGGCIKLPMTTPNFNPVTNYY
jgi:hypothetical protein